MVRVLASHRCVLGSIPGPGVICGLSLLLVLMPAPRVFLRALQFSSLYKTQHSKFQFDPEMRATCLSALLLSVTSSLNKVDYYNYNYLVIIITTTGKCYTKILIKGLADLYWILCASLVFGKILLLCQKLQCLACLPKLCSYKENAIYCVSKKIWM